jgi:hypothetical protein
MEGSRPTFFIRTLPTIVTQVTLAFIMSDSPPGPTKIRLLRTQVQKPLALGVVFLLLVVALLVLTPKQQENHLRILARVPLGSPATALVPLLQEKSVDGSAVHARVLKNGKPHTDALGTFDASLAEQLDGMEYDCDVTLYVKGPWFEHRALVFTFKNGRLVAKDWGHLPG